MKNNINRFKSLALSITLFIGFLFPMAVNAQTPDGFFLGDNDNTQYRENDDNTIGGINNYGIGENVPLGSGLLVLSLAGFGYVALKRKRSYKYTSAMLLACAMVLILTQCKKKTETISNPAAVVEGVHITLDVCGDNNNSKVIVDPVNCGTNLNGTHYATVAYEEGDIIYVGYNGAYVGYLTYDGTNFSGDVSIAAPVGEQPLHFYLLGGKGFTPTFDGNTATVVISDQSEQYPVISYYHSTEVYNGSGEYTAKLRNKCSIMKFNVVTPSSSPICIMGMNNKVIVDFTNPGGTDNGFSYDKDGVGEIKMHGKVNEDGDGTALHPYEMWAIVLPQGDLSDGANEAYTSTLTKGDYYTGTRPAISAIGSNQYISTGVNLTVNETPKFSVSASQKVEFAPANLQATTTDKWSTWTWSFMEHQYSNSNVEGLNDLIAKYNNGNQVTLFKWGANGLASGEKPGTVGFGNSTYSANLTSAEDWGVQVNAANLGGHNNWRTPSMAEWSYVASRKVLGDKDAYGFAVIDHMKGFILLPDNWNGAIDPDFVYGFVEGETNVYTASSWESMEAAGVVFLPAAGYRAAYFMTEFWLVGTYWSTTYGDTEYDYPNNIYRTCAHAFTFSYYGQGYDGDVYEAVYDNDDNLITPGLTSADYASFTKPTWTTTDWRTWIYPTHNPQQGSYTPDPRPAPDQDGWEDDNDFTYYASSVRLIRNVE